MELSKMEDNRVNTSNDNKDVNVNNTSNNESNPFKDVFKEMNSNSNNPMMGLFSGLMNSSNLLEDEDKVQHISKLYEVLTKLSNNKKVNKDDGKELYSLFEDLLEFLLKSETLAEPLSSIKLSVLNYLEKNKDKLNEKDDEKYKTMIKHIDTILIEIAKPQPNKLIIDIFYQLNEMTDFDSELLKDADPSFKEFSQFFGSSKK